MLKLALPSVLLWALSAGFAYGEDTNSTKAADSAKRFSAIPRGVPVVMLNMLKYRELADYGDGKKSITGEQAYDIYREGASKLVAKVGGERVWIGDAKSAIIAPEGEEWDQVFLVRYPSIETFLKMVSSEPYQQIVKHRTAALEDSRLIATIEHEK